MVIQGLKSLLAALLQLLCCKAQRPTELSAATDAINGEQDDPLSHTDGQFGTCREGPRAPPDFHTGTLRTQRQFQADCGFLSGLSVLYLAQMPRALALLTKINQLAGSCHEQLKTQSLSY